jgi:hypothetical protein
LPLGPRDCTDGASLDEAIDLTLGEVFGVMEYGMDKEQKMTQKYESWSRLLKDSIDNQVHQFYKSIFKNIYRWNKCETY